MNNSVLVAVGLVVAFLSSGAFAQGGGVEAKVQLCAACHGPNGNSTDPQYPKLAGQTARYIYLELKDFKEGRRHDPQMEPMAKTLSPEDMLALADYYSKQPSAPTGFKA
ncbi:MAG TPA: cytochrome c, partial [Rhizomicrobium sp.]